MVYVYRASSEVPGDEEQSSGWRSGFHKNLPAAHLATIIILHGTGIPRYIVRFLEGGVLRQKLKKIHLAALLG